MVEKLLNIDKQYVKVPQTLRSSKYLEDLTVRLFLFLPHLLLSLLLTLSEPWQRKRE